VSYLFNDSMLKEISDIYERAPRISNQRAEALKKLVAKRCAEVLHEFGCEEKETT